MEQLRETHKKNESILSMTSFTYMAHVAFLLSTERVIQYALVPFTLTPNKIFLIYLDSVIFISLIRICILHTLFYHTLSLYDVCMKCWELLSRLR